MARAGINKAVVASARNALMARGESPTIDAVRIEMGNTGSKTTIHRYLKELETRQPAGLATPVPLSAELAALVGGLAERLEAEGNARVVEAQQRFDDQLGQVQASLEACRQALSQAEGNLQATREALQVQSEQLAICQTDLQAERTLNARTSQACDDLQVRLDDKDEHIASLEDKHQHARDALAHYRQSVQEQREQDGRRHEAQLQLLQVEVRQLQQSLIVRQEETTLLNRDNERLLLEGRHALENNQRLQLRDQQQTEQLIVAGQQVAKAEGGREELLRQVGELRLQLDRELAINHRQGRENEQLMAHGAAVEARLQAHLEASQTARDAEVTASGPTSDSK
jgi:chromosome segregation ATPase